MSLEPELSAELETAPAPLPARPDLPANRGALVTVFLVVFIDLLGFGIVLPLLPLFAERYLEVIWVGSEHGHLRGMLLGLLMASFSAMQFIFAPLWGRASDRLGRRPILLLGLATSVVFYSLFGFASDFPAAQAVLAVVLLFIARLGAGIGGATIPTAQAVIADCTPPEKRKVGMALIGAAFGIGFTFGPLVGFGSLKLFPEALGSLGYTAAGLSFLAFLLGLFILPETRQFGKEPPHRRGWFSIHDTLEVLRMPSIGILILLFFLTTLGFSSFEPTLALLNQFILGLSKDQNFLVFAYVGLILLFTQGFLYRRLARRLHEESFILMGICLMGLGLLLLGGMVYLAPARPQVSAHSATETIPGSTEVTVGWPLLAGILASLTAAVIGFAFLTPSAQALISRRSDPERQGEVLGVNQSMSALARIFGGFLGPFLFLAHPSHLLPYGVGALLILAMLPLVPRIKKGNQAGP
jgi:MFS family permease